MARKNPPNILNLFCTLPWWCSVLLAMIIYALITLVVPIFASTNIVFQPVSQTLTLYGVYFAGIFLLPVPFSILHAQRKKQVLERQTSIDSIRQLSWQDFELLVAEAYRRKGFQVIENGQTGDKGVIELIITKEGQTHIVQCQQWRTQQVGVTIIREMFSMLTADMASRLIIICCGEFTADAISFASHKPIELINGKQLAELVTGVQSDSGIRISTRPIEAGQQPIAKDKSESLTPKVSIDSTCPRCTGQLVLRTAKRGPKAGKEFLSCRHFPSCRFIQAV